MCGVCTPGVQMLTILPQATVVDLPPYPLGGFTHDIPDDTPFNFEDATKKYAPGTDAPIAGPIRLPDLVTTAYVWWPVVLLVVLAIASAKKGR